MLDTTGSTLGLMIGTAGTREMHVTGHVIARYLIVIAVSVPTQGEVELMLIVTSGTGALVIVGRHLLGPVIDQSLRRDQARGRLTAMRFAGTGPVMSISITSNHHLGEGTAVINCEVVIVKVTPETANYRMIMLAAVILLMRYPHGTVP